MPVYNITYYQSTNESDNCQLTTDAQIARITQM